MAQNEGAPEMWHATGGIVFSPDQIDLVTVARHLAAIFQQIPIEGYVVGRTRLRDATAEHLGCSLLQAEQLVDTLITRGLIQFEREQGPGDPGSWRIRTG
jgi:hypothetical protein